MKLHIGENIKKLRSENSVTQEQLAEHLMITCQAVSKWENNVTAPDVALLPLIADYFEVTVDELFRVNMSGYRNKAERLTVKYDISGRKEDYDKADGEYRRIFAAGDVAAADLNGYAQLHLFRINALMKRAEELLRQSIAQQEAGDDSAGGDFAKMWLIMLLAKMGRGAESIELYEKRVHDEPNELRHWYTLIHAYYPIGRDFVAHKNPEKALEATERAERLFPEDAFLLTLKGFVYYGQGEYEKAVDCFGRSLAKNKAIPDNYFAMAKALEKLGRFEDAAVIFEKLVLYYEETGLHGHIPRPVKEIARLRRLEGGV